MHRETSPPPDRHHTPHDTNAGSRSGSHLRALGVGAVVAALVAVGVTVAAAAEPTASHLPTGPGAAGHHQDTSAHAVPGATAARYDVGPTDAEHIAAALRTAGRHPASGHAGHDTKGAHTASAKRQLAAARRATARFHRLSRAEAAEYARLPAGAPLHECIDEDIDLDDTDGTPAMGIHWINGALLDGKVSARAPEVLVYEPQADGSLDLVAVEYVVFESDWTGATPPTLFGRPFHHFDAPNRYDLPPFYALHAWIWDRNPAGLFANFNPTVSCTNAAAVP